MEEEDFLKQYERGEEGDVSDIDSPFLQGFARFEEEEQAAEVALQEEAIEEEDDDEDVNFDSDEEEYYIRRNLPALGKTRGKDYLRSGSASFTDDIVRKESGGNYRAVNPHSSAAGKYQFLWGTWGDKISQFTGVRSKQEFLNNPEAQDSFYNDYYMPKELMPAVKRLKARGAKMDTNTLAKLVHFRGEKGAQDYLEGKVGDKPEAYNSSISSYIKQTGGYAQVGVNPALGLQNYNNYSPVQKNTYMMGYGSSGVQYSPTGMTQEWMKNNQFSDIQQSPFTVASPQTIAGKKDAGGYFRNDTPIVGAGVKTGHPVVDAVSGQVDKVDNQIAGHLNTFKNIKDRAEDLKGMIGSGISSAATVVTSMLGQKENEDKYYKMLEDLYAENKSQYSKQANNQNLSKSYLL